MPASGLEPNGGSLRIEFKTELEDLPALAGRWETLCLCQSDHDAPFFQSYAWNHHVARVRGTSGHWKPLVATVWRGEELVGIWPLALERSLGARIARSLDDPFGQFAGVAFRSAADIAPGVAAILRAIKTVADGMVIEGVIAGSMLHAALRDGGAQTVSAQQAVFVETSQCRTFGEFEQSMKGETRRRLRNRTKRLRQARDVKHVVSSDATRLSRIIGDVFDGRLQWLHDNGRTSPAFRDAHFRTLLTQIPQASQIDLVGFSLVAGEDEVSTHWGFVYAGRYYWYMSAMKAGYDEFSPGLVHLGLIIEACIDRGLKGLELMPPASRYKLEWSEKVRDVDTLALAFSVKGRAVLTLVHRVMPAARRLSRMLPDTLRKSLIRRLNRS